jgi:hypothetical protein
METQIRIPLELEGEDYQRYLEVRRNVEKNVDSGQLPSDHTISKIKSFVGFDPIIPKFSKQKKEKNMSVYTIRQAAQIWGTSWQRVLAFQRSGIIPKSEINDFGRIKSDFVDRTNFDTLQEEYNAQKTNTGKKSKTPKPKQESAIQDAVLDNVSIPTAVPLEVSQNIDIPIRFWKQLENIMSEGKHRVKQCTVIRDDDMNSRFIIKIQRLKDSN